MDNSFREFLEIYLNVWRTSSLTELKDIISIDYKAREITGGQIIDFGYDESITGWEQGFNFVKTNNAEWEIKELSIVPLRVDEMMVILSATIIIEGNRLDTANLFFQTFKKSSNNNWKLIRSYIEAGVPNVNINKIQTYGKVD